MISTEHNSDNSCGFVKPSASSPQVTMETCTSCAWCDSMNRVAPPRCPRSRSCNRSIQKVVSVSMAAFAGAHALQSFPIQRQRRFQGAQMLFQVAKSFDGPRHKAENHGRKAFLFMALVRLQNTVSFIAQSRRLAHILVIYSFTLRCQRLAADGCNPRSERPDRSSAIRRFADNAAGRSIKIIFICD